MFYYGDAIRTRSFSARNFALKYIDDYIITEALFPHLSLILRVNKGLSRSRQDSLGGPCEAFGTLMTLSALINPISAHLIGSSSSF